MRKATRMLWYNRKSEWIKYVEEFMANGIQKNDSIGITIRTKDQEIIAKWNDTGCGQIWEARTQVREE